MMALHGKFLINNSDFSPLLIYGVGTFMAFSGNGAYRNRGGCVAVPNNGPLPPGKYWVVERPMGGAWSIATALSKDIFSSVMGTYSNHWEWFALYRDDGMIDDNTWINGVKRGQFRLHPSGSLGLSLGCITLQHRSDFVAIRNALLRTTKTPVPRARKLMAYGSIEVIAHGNTCP